MDLQQKYKQTSRYYIPTHTHLFIEARFVAYEKWASLYPLTTSQLPPNTPMHLLVIIMVQAPISQVQMYKGKSV